MNEFAKQMNIIDIFSEHLSNKSKTLDIRKQFKNFNIKIILNEQLSKSEFMLRGERAWNKIYNKTKSLESTDGVNVQNQ